MNNNIYVIMIEDDHEDVQVYLFSNKEKALETAKEWATKLKENYGSNKDTVEIEPYYKEGWLYSFTVNESCHLSVRERSLDSYEDRFYKTRIK